MDGQQLSADQVAAVAKWPSRAEQLSIAGRARSSARAPTWSASLTSVGGALASQISQRGEGETPRGQRRHAVPAERAPTLPTAGDSRRGSAAARMMTKPNGTSGVPPINRDQWRQWAAGRTINFRSD